MATNSGMNGSGALSRLVEEKKADVLFVNADIYPKIDFKIIESVCGRKRRENVVVILVTSGGLPDVSYRIGRCLQENYGRVTIVISGWCKSAGTILCTAANELVFGIHGELGPIDVQLRREDEIGERDSGLSVESAFESLQRASFRLFENCMLDIKDHSYGSITFKTAAEIASDMAVGMVAPIFAQLDPIKIGETHRHVRIAEEYAKRLAIHSGNLNSSAGVDPIDVLLRGYPTHGFVIDRYEASKLFQNVSVAEGDLKELIEVLGTEAIEPRLSDGQIVEFLNEESESGSKDVVAAPSKKVRRRTRGAARTNGASASPD